MKHLPILLLFWQITLSSYAQEEIPAEPTDISPLLIGEKIPGLHLKDISGKSVNLPELVAQKPTLIIFYRGGWCPYCNLHLSELQTIEADIMKLGYQIIAISPDSPENLAASVSKNKLNYLLLSDSGSEASKAFGLAFRAPDRYTELLQKASGGNNSATLPVPGVFVVNVEGEIVFEYINPDYKKRMKSGLLLSVLKEFR